MDAHTHTHVRFSSTLYEDQRTQWQYCFAVKNQDFIL